MGWVSVLLLSFPITQLQIGFEWMDGGVGKAESGRDGVVGWWWWGGVGFRFGPRVILMPFLEVLFYFLVFLVWWMGGSVCVCVWEFFFFRMAVFLFVRGGIYSNTIFLGMDG